MYKILIIEDDHLVRSNLIELLNEEGYEVYYAENGKKGVDLAKNIIPDLIISDVLMPFLNGHEVADELRKDMTTSSIPFIFLTARTETADIQKGFNKGACFYITKPYKIKDLLEAINTSISKVIK